MTNPGNDWSGNCARDYGKPVLPIEKRRSIFTTWPPGTACEMCSQGFESGYAGPTSDDWIEYPAPEIRFVCERCTRSMLSLGDKELYGHSCQDQRCGDNLHVVVKYYSSGAFERLTNSQRLDRCSPEFTEYGWNVVKIEQSLSRDAPDTIGSSGWDVWIQPQKDLPW